MISRIPTLKTRGTRRVTKVVPSESSTITTSIRRPSVISIDISVDPLSVARRSRSFNFKDRPSLLTTSGPCNSTLRSSSDQTQSHDQIQTKRLSIPKICVDLYDDQPQSQQQNPIEDFVARITVAGVEDAYKAKSKLERHAWIGVVLAALAAMLFVSYQVFLRYLDHARVYDDSEVIDRTGPFPNVTVCSPMFGDTKGLVGQTLAEWPISRGLAKRMVRARISLEDVIDFVGNGSMFYVTKMDRNAPLVIISLMLLEEIFRDDSVRRIQKLIQPPCEKILSNCKFEGRSFDCCQVTEYLAVDHGICYQISVHRLKDIRHTTSVSGGASVDPVDLAHTGLAFDASYETNAVLFEDEVAPHGFTVHIDALPTPLAAPVVIPVGAEAMITLAPPVKLTELSGCLREKDQLPRLRWFDHYDPNGELCLSDVILNKTVYELGCTMPMMSYIPDKELVCDAHRVFIIMQLIGGQIDEGTSQAVTKHVNELRDWLRSVYYGNTCPPYCTRWSYPIRSASYGYIQYQNHTIVRNTSMSRFRVFFPNAAYREHSEASTNIAYLIFCEMGGVWGVYLGLSIVSIVQTVFYSLAIARLKTRSGKVRAIG